jgi:hypothetical protein
VTARGTVALVAVFTALLATLWWSEHPADETTVPREAPLLAPTGPPTAVEIRLPDATHRFENVGQRWRAAGAGADPDAVPALLDALTTLTPLLIVDAAPDDPERFGLGPDAVRLLAWSGQSVVLDLDVGARNPAWTGVYVRRHGTRPIVMTGALLTWEIAKVLTPIAGGNTLTKRRESREPSRSRPAKEAP